MWFKKGSLLNYSFSNPNPFVMENRYEHIEMEDMCVYCPFGNETCISQNARFASRCYTLEEEHSLLTGSCIVL